MKTQLPHDKPAEALSLQLARHGEAVSPCDEASSHISQSLQISCLQPYDPLATLVPDGPASLQVLPASVALLLTFPQVMLSSEHLACKIWL